MFTVPLNPLDYYTPFNAYTIAWSLLIQFHISDFSQVATVGNKSWLLLLFFNSLWCQENNAAIYINIIYADM